MTPSAGYLLLLGCPARCWPYTHKPACRGNLQRSQATAHGAAPSQDAVSTSSTDSIPASMVNRFQALQSNTASGSTASDTDAATTPSEGSDHDADMEFARRLQEEEDRIHYQRMLQMAGIGESITYVGSTHACHVILSCLEPSSAHESLCCKGKPCNNGLIVLGIAQSLSMQFQSCLLYLGLQTAL